MKRLFCSKILTRSQTALLATALVFGSHALAENTKTLYMVDKQNNLHTFGQVVLTPKAQGHHAQLTLDDSQLEDFFLSMRPFKCLPHSEQHLCHLPYPYANREHIGEQDLADLSYQLLFIRRQPTDYGINPWFGVYYELNWQNEVGGVIEGKLREVDLDILASPPEEGNYRPITADDLHDADASQHLFPKVLIK